MLALCGGGDEDVDEAEVEVDEGFSLIIDDIALSAHLIDFSCNIKYNYIIDNKLNKVILNHQCSISNATKSLRCG
jgi:hypothetical protein